MPQVDLSRFDNSWYRPGRSRLAQALWYFFGLPLLRCSWLPGSSYRTALLRLFGARVGRGVVIKPGVRVKYPWRLQVGDFSWIGEDVWIDNLADVRIGSHACISQGAYLCTGNHDWSDPHIGLIVRPAELGDASWIGARAIVTLGVTVGEGAVAAAGSLVRASIPAWEIHAGNPAMFVRQRLIRNPVP